MSIKIMYIVEMKGKGEYNDNRHIIMQRIAKNIAIDR